MSDVWRRKSYYKNRVLIDTGKVLDPQFEDALLCITGAQLEMLRNLTQYLHRRSSFAGGYTSEYYLAPTEAEWDDVQAIVADLEETLMGCEELMALFQDMLTQLECVCSTNRSIESTTPTLAPLVDGYLTDGTLIPSDIYGSDTAITAKQCQIAQLTFQRAWDILTIYLQPFQETSADVMLGIILGGFVVTVGIAGLSIPAATIIAVLLGLADMAVEASLTAVRNAITSNKEELICALARGLDTNYGAAHAQARIVLGDIEALTYADKVILGQLFAPWSIWLSAQAWDEQTAWALANVEADYCDDCDEVIGSDWWGLYMDADTNTVEMDHTVGSYWLDGCWQYSVPAGQTLLGVIFHVKNKTGDCSLKRMGSGETGCTGSEIFPNTSENLIPDDTWYFAVDGTDIDWEECQDRLAPDSTKLTYVTKRDGPLAVNGGWQMGFNCTGYADIHVAWVVFEGTSPP